MRRHQTVCSRDAYEKGWLAARQSRSGNVDVSEARFLRRYGHHKVDAWFAGWRDRTSGAAKWTSLTPDGRVSHTDVTSGGDPPTNTPPEKNPMPNKRAKGKSVRSVAMPDTLWARAQKAGGGEAGHAIVAVLDAHLPATEELEREPEPQPV